MIEKFPIFSQLDLSQKSEMESITSQFKPYSDFNFTSLFCWDTDNTLGVSRDGLNIIIRITDYISNKPVYSIIGNGDVSKSVHNLWEVLSLKERSIEVKYLPQEMAERLDTNNFELIEDRDNFDYIYDTAKHIELIGHHFSAERKFLRSFNRQYPNAKVEYFMHLTDAIESEINYLVVEWIRQKGLNALDAKNEKTAIERCLKNFKALGLAGFIVYVDDNPIGFVINEYLPDGFGIAHFEKALYEYDRVYHYVKHCSMGQFQKNGCKYANYEQDLGIEGLRTAKTRYYPDLFLKKYAVNLKVI